MGKGRVRRRHFLDGEWPWLRKGAESSAVGKEERGNTERVRARTKVI